MSFPVVDWDADVTTSNPEPISTPAIKREPRTVATRSRAQSNTVSIRKDDLSVLIDDFEKHWKRQMSPIRIALIDRLKEALK